MNMRWTVLRQLAISCLLVALAVPALARTRPHYGGTLRVEIEGDPWQRPDGLPRRLVFDGLTVLDANGSVRPALATEWESESNHHRWLFRLRPGVHFHDGSSLTSASVVASLTASCTANCPWTALRAVGSSVIFTGESPMPNLPALLAGGDFLISLTVTPEGKTPIGTIGTGPFELTGFNNGALKLIENDTCWQGRPFLDSIEIRVHRPVHDQWLDLGVGRADIVEVPAEQKRQAQQEHLVVLTSPPVTLVALQLADTGALQNAALRAAIAMSIDRSALFNVIFQKQGEVTASLLPQAVTGYSFLFPTDRSLNKARELRGGATPPLLKLTVEGNGTMQLAAQRIALNLREAGFNVQIVSASAGLRSDMTLRSIPLEAVEPAAALEALLRSVGQASPLVEQIPAALYKVEREFLERHTVVPLLILPLAYAAGGRVRDLQLRVDGTPDLAGASLEDAP
jgi:peptide/nickel transport system substrate-binding protein